MADFVKQMCLKELGSRVVTIPAHWGTADIYRELVAEGLAEPVINVNPFMSGFVITEAGRKALASNSTEAPPHPVLPSEVAK